MHITNYQRLYLYLKKGSKQGMSKTRVLRNKIYLIYFVILSDNGSNIIRVV